MTSFGHSKPCQKTMYIYASLSLIISLIKLMSVNYAYNNKKNLTWIFMKGTGCYNVNGSGGSWADSYQRMEPCILFWAQDVHTGGVNFLIHPRTATKGPEA